MSLFLNPVARSNLEAFRILIQDLLTASFVGDLLHPFEKIKSHPLGASAILCCRDIDVAVSHSNRLSVVGVATPTVAAVGAASSRPPKARAGAV